MARGVHLSHNSQADKRNCPKGGVKGGAAVRTGEMNLSCHVVLTMLLAGACLTSCQHGGQSAVYCLAWDELQGGLGEKVFPFYKLLLLASSISASFGPGLYLESVCDGISLTATSSLAGGLASARLLVTVENDVSFRDDPRARVGAIAKMWACPTTGFSPSVTRAQDECQYIAEQIRTEQETRPGDADISFPLFYEELKDFSSGRYLHVHVEVLSTSSSGGQGCRLRLLQHDAIIFLNSSNLNWPSTCPPELTYSQLELVKSVHSGSSRGHVNVKLPPHPYATAPLEVTRVLLHRFFSTKNYELFPLAPGCDLCKGVHVLQPTTQEEQYELAYLQDTNGPLCHVPSNPFTSGVSADVHAFHELWSSNFVHMELPSQFAFVWLGLTLVFAVVVSLHCSSMFARDVTMGTKRNDRIVQFDRTALHDGSDLPPGSWYKYHLGGGMYMWVEVAPEFVEAMNQVSKPRGGRRKAARENALRDLLNFTSAGPSDHLMYHQEQGQPPPPPAAAAAAAIAIAASEASQEEKPKGQKLKQTKQRDRGETQQGQGKIMGQEQGQQQKQQLSQRKQSLAPGAMQTSSSGTALVRTSFAAASSSSAAAGNRGGDGPSLPSASATAAAASVGAQTDAAASQLSGKEDMATTPGAGASPSRDNKLSAGSSHGGHGSSSSLSAAAMTRNNGNSSSSNSAVANTSSSSPPPSTPQPQHFWDFLDRLRAEVEQNQLQGQQEGVSRLPAGSVASPVASPVAAAAAAAAAGFVSSRLVPSLPTAAASASPSTTNSSGSRSKAGCSVLAGKLGAPCVMCQSGRSCVLLRPCFHLILCRECSAILKQQAGACPQCKQTVEAHMPIIKS